MDTHTQQVKEAGTDRNNENAPLTVQPAGGIEKNNTPPKENQNKTAVYVEDWWERLPVRKQAAAVGLLALILIAIAPFSGKPVVEFLVTSSLAIFVGLIALNQYYISKRQWFVMREGIDKTQGLLEQNERIVTEMRNQREISKRQTDIALQQLKTTDRPWLAIEAELTGPLTFDERSAVYVECGIRATNIGRSVALNTTIDAEIVIPQRNPWSEALAKQREACANIHSFTSHTIFPGQSYTSNVRFGARPNDVANGRKASGDLSGGSIAIYLVGCVDYQISGFDTHHQTRFIYELGRIAPDGERIIWSIFVGQDVPIERLVLRRPISGGGEYAD